MRQVNFEGILLGFGWKKNGYDMGKNSWWGNSKMFRLCFMIESPCPGLYDCWKKSLSNWLFSITWAPPLFGRWPLDNPETRCQYFLNRDQQCILAKVKSYSQDCLHNFQGWAWNENVSLLFTNYEVFQDGDSGALYQAQVPSKYEPCAPAEAVGPEAGSACRISSICYRLSSGSPLEMRESTRAFNRWLLHHHQASIMCWASSEVGTEM